MFVLLSATRGSAAIVILSSHGIALGAVPVIVSTLLNHLIPSGLWGPLLNAR